MELNIKIILTGILFFISISSVFASDIDNVTVADNPDVGVCDNATFTDLENDINSLNPSDVYNMDKDYIFKYSSPYEKGSSIIFAQEGVEISGDNVTIIFNNRMDYCVYRDYGAEIMSAGVVCRDYTFTNNHTKYGGAIFNQGVITLEKCCFSNNKLYLNKKNY